MRNMVQIGDETAKKERKKNKWSSFGGQGWKEDCGEAEYYFNLL